jgi:hypothetical protein
MTVLEDVLQFCNALHERRASYRLSIDRPDAIRVTLDVPREYWEIDFFPDRHVELERFVGQGIVDASPADLEAALRVYDPD